MVRYNDKAPETGRGPFSRRNGLSTTATNRSGEFFHGFADTFDTFYDGKRTPVMRWIDQRFRRDMFVRYSLTFDLLGDLQGRTVLDIGCGSVL